MLPALVASMLMAFAQQQPTPAAPPPVKIAVGDQLNVVVSGFIEYSGPATVLEDGTISVIPAGVVLVAGKTINQARALIVAKLKPYLRDPRVTLTITTKADSFIYVLGAEGVTARQAYRTDLDLRMLLAGLRDANTTELLTGTVYRKGQKIAEFNLHDLLTGAPGVWSGPLQSGDLVSLLSAEKIRVWFLNDFERIGDTLVEKGTTVAKAVASMGGPKLPSKLANYAQAFQDRSRIILERGGEKTRFLIKGDPKADQFVLEAGDTLSVESPHPATVTIEGFVKSPAPVTLLSGDSVTSAIAASGGLADGGTLDGVLVWRNHEVRRLDLRAATVGGDGSSTYGVEDGDVVIVPRNAREYRVLGDAKAPGLYNFPDNKTITAADAISLAGGLGDDGSYRRMVLLRPDAAGVYRPLQFNLDEFIKDGKVAANPKLEPGDVLFVNKPKGLSLKDVAGVFPSLFLYGITKV